ncbi:MAG: hypothetical protein IKC22_03075 [Bacilli bacterium]|nr:hypothetical protein [Bacilli bacterium]
MMKNKQLLISMGLNVLIVIFSFIGIILKFKEEGIEFYLSYAFFTNVLTIIICSVFLYQEIKALYLKEEVQDSIKYNKYVVTGMSLLVMIYWVAFLAPLAGNDFVGPYLFQGGSLFLHVLCPILLVISLLGYDMVSLKKEQVLKSLMPTIVYGALIIILNIFHIIIGPYGFFEVYYSPWGVIILVPIGLAILELLILFMVYLLNRLSIKVEKQAK